MNNFAKKRPQSFVSMKTEWNRISWPKRATVTKQTFIVLAISAIIIGVIMLADVVSLEIISNIF